MSFTKKHVAAGGAIAFWLGLIYALSGGRLRLFTIVGIIFSVLSLPIHAMGSPCTSTIVYMPDGKTLLCTTCGSVTNCV